ncbi:MAG: hypothetical protein EAY75_03350 [Bacteroidetes bacterium]|nr:MAG: hypothetical protein EAY75_03350 [Bacteroidota bacterium]
MLSAAAQSVNEVYPTLGPLVDKSAAGELAFLKYRNTCAQVYQRVSNQDDYENLSDANKKRYNDWVSSTSSYWDVFAGGCTWYCGGGLDTISASSALQAYRGINYLPKNIHDRNYKTAWIEGAPGYGIGEYITYHFPPHNPRITEIKIVNGYVKSPLAWRNNSRVKKLKMYVDGKPFAILNLADSRQEQYFKFEPIGYGDREDLEQLRANPWWSIRFEILAVYKGNKYDDTAITEIYFDGIDVHQTD